MKKWKCIFVFCVMAYGIERFCHKQTDGFHLSHIFTTLPETSVSLPPNGLYQPFHYLGKGGQFYVFLSQDGNYVLKFFKGNHIKALQLNELVSSCILASDILEKECALLYSHLGSTPSLCIPITLVDKLNITHKIDGSRTGFILQRYAVPVKTHIDHLMKQGLKETAQQALNALFSLIKTCKDMGISHHDANLLTNFGFVDGQPIFTDIGNFSYSNAPQEKIKGQELLTLWLDTHYPTLRL